MQKKTKGALTIGAALAAAQSTEAATFNVTSNADTGAGSLRAAVASANANPGADTITFDAAVTGTIALTPGEIPLEDALTIAGPGAGTLSISGSNLSRIFYVYEPDATTAVDVVITGLTLTNGNADSSGGAINVLGENLTLNGVTMTNNVAAGDGGALAMYGACECSGDDTDVDLTIRNSIISGNTAFDLGTASPGDEQGGIGGGVAFLPSYNDTALFENVTISGNRTLYFGGGIGIAGYYGEVTVRDSTIRDNIAGLPDYGESFGGAGIGWLSLYGGTLTIEDTTIADNDTLGTGGGLLSFGVESTTVRGTTISGNTAALGGGIALLYSEALVENSTIAGNDSATFGGGLYSYYAGATIAHSTISGNTADAGGGFAGYYDAYTTITSSIVANNVAPTGPDLYNDESSPIELDHSLIEDPSDAFINDNGDNLLGQDPQLGPLQNNGGPTFTLAPAPTSPVVNAVDPAEVTEPATDQRGFARLAGPAIDMGAVELQATGTVQFAVASMNVNENGITATINVTRTGGAEGPASAQVTVGGGTATGGGVDYIFAGTTVNFAANDATPQSFNIAITNDALFEGNETIVLQLGSVTGGTLGTPATHTLTIIDDDSPSADLRTTKTISPGPYFVGGSETFTITVTNAGPQTATAVTLTDILPAQVTLISANASQGTCSGTTTVTCTLGNIASGSSATVTLAVTLNSGGPISNTATAASPTADPVPGNNAGSVTITAAAAGANIPTLAVSMQLVLAALIAAAALATLKR